MFPVLVIYAKVATPVAAWIVEHVWRVSQGFLVAQTMQPVVSSVANAVKILQQRAALMMQSVAKFKQSAAPLQHVVLRKTAEQ